MAWLGRRLRRIAVLPLLIAVAALVALTPSDAAAQAPLQDRWSGSWAMTFTTSGGGQERTTGTLCCMTVTRLSDERGRALANGTTGEAGDLVFTDVVCASAAPHLYFEGLAPFEFVSGHQGVVPGPDRPTNGARAVFCTDEDPPFSIRGHYKNDLAAFDPLISQPVQDGSLLARLGTGPTFEGSLTHFPGDSAGRAFGTVWEGLCQSGACRAANPRPKLRLYKLSIYNALLGFLRGARGARLELTRSDGTATALKRGETIELGDGDVITSHGMYAEVRITRADNSVVIVTLEPGGSISGLADPTVIRHRGGRVVMGSAAGFTADSAVFGSGSNARAHQAAGSVRTAVSAGGRVALELDPAGRRLSVRALAGRAQVQAGAATLTVGAGQETLATARGVRRLAPAPDLSRSLAAPRTLSAGPVRLLVSRAIGSRALARSRCLATRLTSAGAAKVAVTLLVGTARRGNPVVQRRLTVAAGTSRTVCLPLSVKARGIPAGTPLTVALGIRVGTRRSLATGRVALRFG